MFFWHFGLLKDCSNEKTQFLGVWRDVMRRRRFTLLLHCKHVIVTLFKTPLNDHTNTKLSYYSHLHFGAI